MKKILIIGIGAGNPEYVTIQAVKALNHVDVFFILDKGASKEKLVEFRRELCRRYIKGRNYRFVDAEGPENVALEGTDRLAAGEHQELVLQGIAARQRRAQCEHYSQ